MALIFCWLEWGSQWRAGSWWCQRLLAAAVGWQIYKSVTEGAVLCSGYCVPLHGEIQPCLSWTAPEASPAARSSLMSTSGARAAFEQLPRQSHPMGSAPVLGRQEHVRVVLQESWAPELGRAAGEGVRHREAQCLFLVTAQTTPEPSLAPGQHCRTGGCDPSVPPSSVLGREPRDTWEQTHLMQGVWEIRILLCSHCIGPLLCPCSAGVQEHSLSSGFVPFSSCSWCFILYFASPLMQNIFLIYFFQVKLQYNIRET